MNYRGESHGGAAGSSGAVPASAVVAAGPTGSVTAAAVGTTVGDPLDSHPSIIRIPVSDEGPRASAAAGRAGTVASDPPPRDPRDQPEVKVPPPP